MQGGRQVKRHSQIETIFAGIILFSFLTINIGLGLASGYYAFVNPVRRVDLALSSISNSNFTGYATAPGFVGYARNVTGQSVHSNFLNDTNSCTTCHMSHVAPGQYFLFQKSVYNICTACHFSDLANTYNVLQGSSGGRFFDPDFDPDRYGPSQHLCTGARTHADAPGAAVDNARRKWWESKLTCGSCHAPHGSLSPRRYLQVNPNGNAARYGPVRLLRQPDGRYRPEFHGEKLPWLYYDQESELFSTYGVIITDGSGNRLTDGAFVHYREGYVEIDHPDNGPYSITFSQALIVEMDVETDTEGNETVTYRAGVVNFCVSCHTSYLRLENDAEGSPLLYTDHVFFTHRINQDVTSHVYAVEPDSRFKLEIDRQGSDKRLVCLSCHYAHGTDTSLIVDSEFNFMYQPLGPAPPPENTYNLRYGERESCKFCHLNLLSLEPSDSAQLNSPPGEIRFVFDQALDMQTVIAGDTLTVSDGVYQVAGTLSPEGDRTVVFRPAEAFESGRSYFITISCRIKSALGRVLPRIYQAIFSVHE